MDFCKYCVDFDVQRMQAKCSVHRKIVAKELCIKCNNYLWRYKDLDIGQCFFDTDSQHFGIKLTSCRAYDLDHCKVYGFYGNHANDSDYRHYLKANMKWW